MRPAEPIKTIALRAMIDNVRWGYPIMGDTAKEAESELNTLLSRLEQQRLRIERHYGRTYYVDAREK